MLPSEKLAELGLELPAVATPVAAYVPAVIDRGVVRTSGQIPVVNGEPVCIGAVGEDGADPEDAKDAARVCALNALAAAAVLGRDRVGVDELEHLTISHVFSLSSGPQGHFGKPHTV